MNRLQGFDARKTPVFRQFFILWDSLEFALFRPAPEKAAFIGTTLMVIWRWLHYNVTGDPATPIFPGAILGITVHLPVLPISSVPWLGWYLAMGAVILLLLVSHKRTYLNKETLTRDPTWAPMFYFSWTLLIIVGLLTIY